MFRAKSQQYEIPDIEKYHKDTSQDIPSEDDPTKIVEKGRKFLIKARHENYQWMGHSFFKLNNNVFPTIKNVFESVVRETVMK